MSELKDVTAQMKKELEIFETNCDQEGNKAAAQRARNSSMAFQKLGKRYRKLSVAANK